MSFLVLHYCGLHIFLDIIQYQGQHQAGYGYCRILEIICTLYTLSMPTGYIALGVQAKQSANVICSCP
ncbi:hypothetical protein Peur_040004 [Populus x canadensis]